MAIMLYAQATGKDSLRDMEASLITHQSKLYHLGINSVSRSTLSDANSRRDWHLFESLFYEVLCRCQDLTPKHKFKFKNPLYSLDATVIKLVLSVLW